MAKYQMMEENKYPDTERRIKESLGWIELSKSVDGEYKIEMLREKISIWKTPEKDRILRLTKIDKNE